MKLLYKGKTKDVYEINADTVLLQFKNDVTGVIGVFDPGANTVGLSIDGMGKSGLRLTEFFFKKLNEKNIPTHFISADIENATMTVQKAEPFGKGLEVICRYKAVGSFLRRYGMYAKEGQDLDAFVEVTLKDDARNDPPITKDALAMLNLLSHEEYDILKKMTQEISGIIKDELAKKGLVLYDIKLEFGRVGADKHIALVDEISGGNMRAYKDASYVEPMKLEQIMLS